MNLHVMPRASEPRCRTPQPRGRGHGGKPCAAGRGWHPKPGAKSSAAGKRGERGGLVPARRDTSTSSCCLPSCVGLKLLFTPTSLDAIFSAKRKISLTNVFPRRKICSYAPAGFLQTSPTFYPSKVWRFPFSIPCTALALSMGKPQPDPTALSHPSPSRNFGTSSSKPQ